MGQIYVETGETSAGDGDGDGDRDDPSSTTSFCLSRSNQSDL